MLQPNHSDERPFQPPPISYVSPIAAPPAVFTTEDVDGHEIVAYLGLVYGSCSLSSTSFLILSADRAYDKAIQIAQERLTEAACRRQANAIIGLRMMDGARVTLYGTAVLARPLRA